MDEIGELPYRMQTKLLGVLQNKEIIRIGGHKRINITAKFVFATNADLSTMIKNNKFRLDLYYRISFITIKIPPLRERIEDIPYLIGAILNEANEKYEKNSYLSLNLLNVFLQHSWPGNIRELKNITEKLVVFTEKDRIGIDDLLTVGEYLGSNSDDQLSTIAIKSKQMSENNGLKEWVNNYEQTVIRRVLHDTKTLKEASNILKIDVSTLVRKKQKYSI